MAISFPTSLDNFTNPSSGNTLDSPSHSLQHSDINDAVEALERKIGVGTAVAGSASAGQVLTISAAGTSTWSNPVQGLTQVIPTSVAVGSGSGSVDANGAVTFSGASSISLNSCFNSTYDNYRILVKFTAQATSNADYNLRMRLSGTDASGSDYFKGSWLNYFNSGTLNANNQNAATSILISGNVTSSVSAYNVLDILTPFLTQKTGIVGSGQGENPTYSFANGFSGIHNLTTSYDGFTIFASAGTFTGTLRIYGYRN